MRHDNVLKKLNGQGAGLGLGGSADLIYYYHVAAFVVPLNLKKLNFDFLTQTQGRRDGSAGKIYSTLLLLL